MEMYRPIRRFRVHDRLTIEVSPNWVGASIVVIVDGILSDETHIDGEFSALDLAEIVRRALPPA